MPARAALAPAEDALAVVAAVLRALADPTRLAIAAQLSIEKAPLCVCHIEARFHLSQPTISHHLRILREVGLVTSERRGTWVHYALDHARVAAVPGLSAMLSSVAPPAKRCKECC